MAQPKITLYHSPHACSIVPHILLEESGLEYTVEKPNLRDPAEAEAYKKNVNPKGQVPALLLDNQVITEGPAIQTAISQLAPQLKLFGETPLETVRTYEWLNWLSGTIHALTFGGIFGASRMLDSPEEQDHLKASMVKKLTGIFANIDERVAGKEFAQGSRFTGIDGYLVLFYYWAQDLLHLDTGSHPNYDAYVAALKKAQER